MAEQVWSLWVGQNEYLRRQVENCDDFVYLAHKQGSADDQWEMAMSKTDPKRLLGLAIMLYDRAHEAKLVPPRTWGREENVVVKDREEKKTMTLKIPASAIKSDPGDAVPK